jgi:hypothetical protein
MDGRWNAHLLQGYRVHVFSLFQEADLQSELSKRGLETAGSKDELIQRLQEHSSADGSSSIDSKIEG